MLNYSELNIFCEQIAMVLKAGISVYEGICMLHSEATTSFEKDMLQGIIDSMDEGISFPEAIEKSGFFPKYMIDMITIGETSGRLDTVLDQLGRYYKREQMVQNTVRQAVSYPIIMMLMMGVVIFVLVAKVLPIFNSVFADLGSELTGFSKTVMDMGLAFSDSLGVILVLIILVLIGGLVFTKTEVGKKKFKYIKENFYLMRNLTNKIAVSRFAAGMSLMLASGLDIDQSLEMVLPLVDNEKVYQKIESIRKAISEGQNFAEAVMDNQIFTGTYNRMLAIGYRTGATDEVIENISKRYEDEIETSLSNIIAVIEPSLVAVLSIVVGVILLSVMLPLMSIMSAI
ncbi:MAG: type II secretion system F family protein [Eubacteriales bacterium]